MRMQNDETKQNKMHNYYLIVSKLAGNSVRRAICQENGFDDIKTVSIKFSGREPMIKFVGDVMRCSKGNVVATHKQRANDMLFATSSQPMNHEIDKGQVFTESVVKSKDARICQRQLVNYLMAETYFIHAFEYDKKYGSEDKYSAVDKAKAKLREMFSLNFLSGFIFDKAKCPVFDQTLKDQLSERAFDPLYSCTNKDVTDKLVRDKYKKDFCSEESIFSNSPEAIDRYFNVQKFKEQIDGSVNEAVDESFAKAVTRSANPASAVDLYRDAFLKMPTAPRRRKFINLKNRNSDIITCPMRKLGQKKQYADIEYKTKHDFIMDCYKDRLPENSNIEEARHYFNYEASMYRKIVRLDSSVAYKQGKLYFPDGAVAAIPSDMKPYEILHKINAIYAALFGFTGEDIANPTDWLYNSIRSAYTDEGVALYRQAMIEARMRERI